MARYKEYKIGIEQEMVLNITSLLPKDHLVFFIEKSVNEIDTSPLESTSNNLGRLSYHPKMLLSILFYGYTKGIRSGRMLEKACQEDIGFLYLSKGYFPKKTVINDFRCKHYKDFERLFKEVLMLFEKPSRDGSLSIIDGSKVKANASKKRTKTPAKYKKWMEYLSEDIIEIDAALLLNLDETSSTELKKKNSNC